MVCLRPFDRPSPTCLIPTSPQPPRGGPPGARTSAGSALCPLRSAHGPRCHRVNLAPRQPGPSMCPRFQMRASVAMSVRGPGPDGKTHFARSLARDGDGVRTTNCAIAKQAALARPEKKITLPCRTLATMASLSVIPRMCWTRPGTIPCPTAATASKRTLGHRCPALPPLAAFSEAAPQWPGHPRPLLPISCRKYHLCRAAAQGPGRAWSDRSLACQQRLYPRPRAGMDAAVPGKRHRERRHRPWRSAEASGPAAPPRPGRRRNRR